MPRDTKPGAVLGYATDPQMRSEAGRRMAARRHELRRHEPRLCHNPQCPLRERDETVRVPDPAHPGRKVERTYHLPDHGFLGEAGREAQFCSQRCYMHNYWKTYKDKRVRRPRASSAA